jgi:hypothetical protein
MKKTHDPDISSARAGYEAIPGGKINHLLKDSLAAAAVEESEKAAQKMQNTSYWGDVGFIEVGAVERAREIIDAVLLDLAPEAYRLEIVRRFNEQIEIYRRDDVLDPDGYGLGTLYDILRKAGLSHD